MDDCVEVALLLIEVGEKNLLLMTDAIQSNSALHDAADKGHVESMLQLIAAGGMELVLLRNKYGVTALHKAAMKGHVEVARLLIGAGGQAAFSYRRARLVATPWCSQLRTG